MNGNEAMMNSATGNGPTSHPREQMSSHPRFRHAPPRVSFDNIGILNQPGILNQSGILNQPDIQNQLEFQLHRGELPPSLPPPRPYRPPYQPTHPPPHHLDMNTANVQPNTNSASLQPGGKFKCKVLLETRTGCLVME